MKKIDNWLSIQRFVFEAATAIPSPLVSNIEVMGKAAPSRFSRKARRFLVPRISTI